MLVLGGSELLGLTFRIHAHSGLPTDFKGGTPPPATCHEKQMRVSFAGQYAMTSGNAHREILQMLLLKIRERGFGGFDLR